MIVYTVRRIGAMVPILVLVTIIVFSLVLVIPGDPALTLLGEFATEEQLVDARERLGLNEPLLVQYWDWLSGVLQGDLGTSLFGSRSVGGAIAERFPATLSLTLLALAVSLVIAVPAGIWSATHRGSFSDTAVTVGASLGVAIPNYWLGLLLILVFAIWNDWLPAVGYTPLTEDPVEWLRRLILPAVTLGTAIAAETTRQIRSALIDVLGEDYIRTARAKGMRRKRVVLKHALKNAAIPVVTVIGLQTAFLLGGTVVIESIFGIPGLGSLAVSAVFERDIPLIQGIVLVAAVVVLLVNLIVDLLYGWLDPRVRLR